MGSQNEAAVLGLEIERVRSKVPVAFEVDDTWYSMLDTNKNVEVISGRDMRVPIKLRPGGKFGHYDPNGGDLGRGSGPFFDKAVIGAVHFKHAFEWTKKSDMVTEESRKAVLSSFRDLMATSMDEFRRQVDSACLTAGNGVVVANTTLSAGGGTGGADRWTIANTDGFGVRLVRFDQDVSIYNTGLTTKRGEATINFIDLENRIVDTLPATAGTVTGDKLVFSGLSGSTPVGIFGLPYHHSNASSGFWLGFDRSLVPEIRANAVNANNAALSLQFARLALNKAGNRVGRDKVGKVVAMMHPAQKAAYEEMGQLATIIQKQPKAEALNMYFNDDMQMAGAPVKEHFSWDKTRIDFVNISAWGRAQLQKAGFYTDPASRKFFEVRGQSGGVAASFLFYLTVSMNVFIDNPACATYIYGLPIPAGY